MERSWLVAEARFCISPNSGLFFRWYSSEAKLTRRQRIRLLTRLNRLTEANPIEVISQRGSPANLELIEILHELAAGPRAKVTLV